MQVKKMYSRIVSQIFTWAGEEPLTIEYNGEQFIVPPRHMTAKLGPGSVYRHESARDEKGNLIPGTLLVTDVIQPTGDGGVKRTLTVSDVCDYLASYREELFARGFNIVSTIQEVDEAIQTGIPLWETSQDERARGVLSNELARRKKYEERGEPAPASLSDHLVAWAIKHLNKRRLQAPAIKSEDLVAALHGRYIEQPKQAEAAPMAAVPIVPDRASEIFEEADNLGIPLSKAELAGLLKADQEQTSFVLEKIKIKKEALGQQKSA